MQWVPLLESMGRVLASPIRADRDQPPFARSTRDGFACRAADLQPGRRLKVIGQVRAGERWSRESADPLPASGPADEIASGEAVEIMTGAPVPFGADCVVMVEHVEECSGAIQVREGHELSPGSNIVPAGAEARMEQVVLPSGLRMAPAQIAAAAACGAGQVSVFARPRVAILATGDELVELGDQPQAHQIRNSNSYSLAAQLLMAGADPLRLPIARDEAAHLQSLVEAGFEADMLLISGGVSMGKYDLVEQVLLAAGAEFFFTGARIQPGKPIVFGRIAAAGGPRYFFGLPGNPVSTMVTFSLFVEPLLRALAGQPYSGPRFAEAVLKTGLRGKPGLTRFLPAVLHAESDQTSITPEVEPVPWQGSGDLANTSRSNCFLVVPADHPVIDAGERVTVLL